MCFRRKHGLNNGQGDSDNPGIDPNPTPDPTPDPDPGPTPDPTPDPGPNPEPDPTPDPGIDPTPDPTPDPDPEPGTGDSENSIQYIEITGIGITAAGSDYDEAVYNGKYYLLDKTTTGYNRCWSFNDNGYSADILFVPRGASGDENSYGNYWHIVLSNRYDIFFNAS